MQFEAASKGNVTMQIWLGKQYLGQTDHAISEVRQIKSGASMTLDEAAQQSKEFFAAHPDLIETYAPEHKDRIQQFLAADDDKSGLLSPARHAKVQ
ncbi:MAG: hypothetical protein ABSH49_13325 [Bryobacteraceae bacterium]|jgi:hypothetical protein